MRDRAGQLGNGTIEASEAAPRAVGSLPTVSAISAGGQDSAALLSSGSVMTWGNDQWGALGDGASDSPSDVPVTVSGITEVVGVSVGALHMLAFGEPVPEIVSVSPKLGPRSGGTVVTITGANLEGASAVRFGGAQAAAPLQGVILPW